MLARMLAAEERDNARMQDGSERRGREQAENQNNQDAEVQDYGITEDDYISSGITSSYDFLDGIPEPQNQ